MRPDPLIAAYVCYVLRVLSPGKQSTSRLRNNTTSTTNKLINPSEVTPGRYNSILIGFDRGDVLSS